MSVPKPETVMTALGGEPSPGGQDAVPEPRAPRQKPHPLWAPRVPSGGVGAPAQVLLQLAGPHEGAELWGPGTLLPLHPTSPPPEGTGVEETSPRFLRVGPQGWVSQVSVCPRSFHGCPVDTHSRFLKTSSFPE